LDKFKAQSIGMKSLYAFIVLLQISIFSAKAQNLETVLTGLNNDQQKADTVFKYARKFFQRAKFDQAAQWLDEGMVYARRTNNDTLISQYYVEMGNTSIMRGQADKALQQLWNAKAGLGKTFSYYHLNSCYILLAKCHTKFDNSDSALYYYRKAEELNNTYNRYRNWITYVEMGSFFAGTSNFTEAEKYYEKAYQITKEKGIRGDHGLTLYHLSDFYLKQNRADRFAYMVNEQQEFTKGAKKDFSKDPVHSFLYMDWGDKNTGEKISFLKNVKQNLLSEGNFINGALVNEEIAKIFEEDKQYEEALKYIDESIRIAEKDNSSINIYMYNKVAYRLLKKAGKLKEAAEKADKLFSLKDSLTKKQNLDLALELDTRYQSEKKEKEIALLNSQKELDRNAITLLNTQNALSAKEIALLSSDKKLAAIRLQREMEMRSALQRENGLMDSIVSSEKAISRFVNREKEKETALNAALGRENILKEELRWSLLAGAGVLLLSGISIFMLYKKQRKKNAIIQKQSADLEVLMKEIHHRVKNNLQVVSSLLDLQSHTISDTQASAAVKEGKNRVQSMALIHQNLYSEGNIKGIMVKEYIGNLVQSLSDSYNISNDKVKININIDDLNLDVDTMIPLGLVLNELVSNSFKYAFKENHPGILNIQLNERNEKLHLKVSDNGTGFPADVDIKSAKSFGLKMIRAFAQKLKATLDIYNNNGAVVEMQITKFKAA
jgi:two-component system, sensor histidine kinase PdtaS